MVIQTVFESPEVLVVDKPAGMLSVPSRWGDRDPRPCVQAELSRSRGEKLWPVHRLDEEVSGLLVFARNPDIHRRLSMAFESRDVSKEYEAWSRPVPEAQVGGHWRFESNLVRGKKRTFEAPHGKPSITEAVLKALEEWEGQSIAVWRLAPVTGRSHQLRVHLAKFGAPILGDALYGSHDVVAPGAIALRHVRLSVPGFSPWEVAGLRTWLRSKISP